MGGPGPGEPGERKAEGEMLAGVKLSGSGNWGKNMVGGGSVTWSPGRNIDQSEASMWQS